MPCPVSPAYSDEVATRQRCAGAICRAQRRSRQQAARYAERRNITPKPGPHKVAPRQLGVVQ